MSDMIGNRTLSSLLEEKTQRHPDKTFLVYESLEGDVSSLTYAQILDWALRASQGFEELGIGTDDKVCVHLSNRPEFLCCWLALAKLGAVMVPSNTANQDNELTHILGFSDAKLLVTESRYLELASRALEKVPSVQRIIVVESSSLPPGTISFEELTAGQRITKRPVVNSTDPAEIIFTSGTTARPKGVVLTHANCLWSGERASKSMAFTEDERCLTALPIFHVNAQSFSFLAALSVGGTLILLESYSANKFWGQVRRYGATHTSLVAMQVRTLLSQPKGVGEREHSLRHLTFAINVSDKEKEEFEDRFGVRFMNSYGLTEALTMVSVSPLSEDPHWPSVGRPAMDRDVRITGVSGEELGSGEVGEITVHGNAGRTIMKGYYKDAQETDRVMRDGWLHTGDNGYLDEDGFLYFFERSKDVIKRSGENISASEVETVLLDHPSVVEAAVIGVFDPLRDEAVKAFVVRRSTADLAEEDVREFCQQQLAHFKVPTVVEFRDALPKTSIGKIEKRSLRNES